VVNAVENSIFPNPSVDMPTRLPIGNNAALLHVVALFEGGIDAKLDADCVAPRGTFKVGYLHVFNAVENEKTVEFD
jgi:hypothetical protein